jgi:nucleoside 2-deoxyribosyltransferase
MPDMEPVDIQARLSAGVGGEDLWKLRRETAMFAGAALAGSDPDLEDVKNAIKDTFGEFGVHAVTADDIEHAEAITDRVLQEIETSEFLFADLTNERPNVYYEVGHAHALKKRVMLYRKAGTRLHFDLAHRNCPEYPNVTGLKALLRKRLEDVTNKPRTA